LSAGAGGRIRLGVLGAVVLLAAGGSVVWRHREHHAVSSELPTPSGPVFAGRVGILQPSGGVDPCGIRIGPRTAGVRHAQLPCGVRVYLTYGGTTVLTDVVDQGPTGRDEFELTPALADLLGRISTGATVHWRFAR